MARHISFASLATHLLKIFFSKKRFVWDIQSKLKKIDRKFYESGEILKLKTTKKSKEGINPVLFSIYQISYKVKELYSFLASQRITTTELLQQ